MTRRMNPVKFFQRPEHPLHRLYEALRAYYVDDLSASEVARRFGYSSQQSVRVLASRFTRGRVGPFFRDIPRGWQYAPVIEPLRETILELRARNLSVLDIADSITKTGKKVSYHTVWRLLRAEGVSRLPRRSAARKASPFKEHPPVADAAKLDIRCGRVIQCRAPLILLYAPLLEQVEFDSQVSRAGYPGTSKISASSYLRSLLLLKLVGCERRNHVMPIADDEGYGLFAGLNVLPKTTALSDYSYRVGPEPHRALLGGFVQARDSMNAYPSLSFNLDFHTIPHYGDVEKSGLENDYKSSRGRSVRGVIAAFAQEIVSREMVYSRANIMKREKNDEVLRFVDFWTETTGKVPKELVFDCHMTIHKVLAEINRRGIEFITLRDRRQNAIKRVLARPPGDWDRVELDVEDRKWRTPRVLDETTVISDYPGKIRQLAAIDLGRPEPTFLLTNNRRQSAATLLTRYARRALIENSLSEQVRFFHVDALSSSVRIKVDLDVVLSVVASGCYRWLADQLRGLEKATARRIWNTFLDRPGKIRLGRDEVNLQVRRFSRAPQLLELSEGMPRTPLSLLGGRTLRVEIT